MIFLWRCFERPSWCIRGGARVVGLHGGVPGGVVESRFGARGGARHVAVMGHKLVCIIMLLLARHSADFLHTRV